jgi:uncharacterized damage-inducible protein DinB
MSYWPHLGGGLGRRRTMPAEQQFGEAHARRLERVYEELAALLHQPDSAQRIRRAPDEQAWSALQVLGHMAEMIPYWLHHCQRLIAASGEPPQFGRSLDAPERLAGVERVATHAPDEALRLLHDEIRAAAGAIRRFSEAELNRKGVHVRQGEMSVAEVVARFIVAHAEEHLAQVRAALQA